jgi:hypothetical protein
MTSRDGAARIREAAREAFGDPEILVVFSPGAVPDPETGRWRGAFLTGETIRLDGGYGKSLF